MRQRKKEAKKPKIKAINSSGYGLSHFLDLSIGLKFEFVKNF
jgi:hypothetical protein